jgi:hypothetical protein
VRDDGQELVPGLVDALQPLVLRGQLPLGLLGQVPGRELGLQRRHPLLLQLLAVRHVPGQP